ncbi:hypothetical protein ACFL1I_08210 [Candidatus Omnitrophota bacterium]
MKKITILFIFILLVLYNLTALAYQIKTKDTYAYEFKDGKKTLKGGAIYNCIYEVNEEKKIITLLSAVTTLEGKTRDTAEGNDKQIYDIAYKQNGNLTAIWFRPQGEEVIAFKSDGTYCILVTTFLPKIPGTTLDIDGFYTNLVFGNYTVNLEDVK